MPNPITFEVWADSLDRMTYYEVLRVPRDADADRIRGAFHELALRCHPDRYVDEDPAVGKAASRVFKRAAEAYRVLSVPTQRKRYDELVKNGKIRMTVDDKIVPKEAPKLQTIAAVTTTADGRRKGVLADHHLSLGNLEGARIALIDACNCEPGNAALKERLQMIYEAEALS